MKQLITDFGVSKDGIPEFSNIEADEYGLSRMRGLMRLARFGKGGGSPPPAPDPQQTAQAQAAANKETAISQQQLNMVNQYTPYGNLEYRKRGTYGDGTPAYSAYQTLAPKQAQMKTLTDDAGIKYGQTANNQLSAISGALSKPMSFGSLGPAPMFNQEYRDEIAQSMYDRLNPQFDRDQNALEQKLVNQGLMPGSEAWNQALGDMNRAKTDARLAIDSAALGQAAQMYGLEESGRNSRINEIAMLRSQPLNELAAMLTGSQVQNPQFVNTPVTGVANTDVAGPIYANYQGALNNYNQRQASGNGFMSGLFNLGGSLGAGFLGSEAGSAALAGLFSDRRLKKNVSKIGELSNGLNLYEYEYIWGGGRKVGVMADEVKAVLPSAVFNVGGFDAVDYNKVLA